MVYTPSELTAEMARLGYPVTRRRLTDWVQKGLLPAPRPRGLGQGRGKVYRWVEPDILHRALDVAELIRWHRRTSDLFLPLWVLGYDVPVAQVREGLRTIVEGLSAGLEAAIPFRGDRSDLISDLLAGAQEQLERQPQRLPDALVAPFLHAFIDPAARDWALLLEELQEELTTEPDRPTWPFPDGAAAAAALVRDQLSVPRLEAVVVAASEHEMIAVHHDLQTVVRSVRSVAHVGLTIPPSALLRILVVLGTCGAIGDLALRRGGHGVMVDHVVAQVVDGCQRMLTDPRLRADLVQLRSQTATDRATEQGEPA